MSIVSVYAVFANSEEAERIGRTVIEEKLAACINILAPCRSIYRWKGEIETAEEVPAILKTHGWQADELVERIAALHSYETPCIAVCPIEKLLRRYADWVEDSVLSEKS
jgi:periplasmic divalent cation tolerance protein